jgi:CheY-like chemotaxis protein
VHGGARARTGDRAPLVELHGGTVTASSPGERTWCGPSPSGSRSAPPRHSSDRPTRACRSSGSALAGLRLVVVDDEPDTREMVAATLEAHGRRWCRSATPRRRCAGSASNSADLLVSDVAMPRMDGCALIRELRRTGTGAARAHPAVALTAYAPPRSAGVRAGRGVPGLLDEAVEPEVLVARVAALARASRGGLRSPRAARRSPVGVTALGRVSRSGPRTRERGIPVSG